MDSRNGMTLNILICFLLPLSAVEAPIVFYPLTAFPGIRIKVNFGAWRKRGAGSYLMFGDLGKIHWTRAFIKSCLTEFNPEWVSSLMIRNQATDMVWFSDTKSVTETIPCTSSLTSGKANGDPDCEASAPMPTSSCLEEISQKTKARMEEEAYNKGWVRL